VRSFERDDVIVRENERDWRGERCWDLEKKKKNSFFHFPPS
jgi:hypothetical protein